MIQLLFLCLLCSQIGSSNLSQADNEKLASLKVEAEKKWEKEVQKLEELDRTTRDPDNSILFIGSSSIRLWESMAEDMAPWPTIRRGYGGAKFSDLVVFTERLTKNHSYRALVVFVANDITGGDDDRTPEEVQALCKLLVTVARQHHPDKPIFFIAITPNSKRFHVWDRIDRANELIKAYTESDPKLFFIDTVKHYLNDQGKPRDELFVEDKLHQNRTGYKLWSSIIKPALAEKLGNPIESQLDK